MIQREGSFTFLLCCTTASVTALCFFLLFLYVQHLHRSSRAGKPTSATMSGLNQAAADNQPTKPSFNLPQVNLDRQRGHKRLLMSPPITGAFPEFQRSE